MSTAASAAGGKARGTRPRTKDSRELLLGYAAKLFREKGYTATSVRDIVKRAHIEPSALYYHFASKQALLDAVLDRSITSVMAQVREALDQLPQEATPRERFCVAIATHIRSMVLHGDFALAGRRVMGQIPPALRRKHDALRATYGDFWQTLFSQAAQRNDFRDDAKLGLARMFLMGAINWTTEWFDPKIKSPEELAAVFCDILFAGLGPRPQTARATPARQRRSLQTVTT